MLHLSTSLCVAAVPAAAVVLISAPVRADLPPAFDYVPPEAGVVLGVSNVQDLLGKVERYNAEVMDLEQMGEVGGGFGGGMGLAEVLEPLRALSELPGLNLRGSAAAVFDGEHIAGPGLGEDGDEAAPALPGILILPVSDFRAFTEGVSAEGVDGRQGVVSFEIEGETLFARDLGGGFAVLAPAPEGLAELRGGHAARNAERLGALGRRVADGADAFVFADVESLRATLGEQLENFGEMEEQFEAMAPMMGGGEQAQQALAGMRLVQRVLRDFLEQGEAALMGIRFAEEAMVIDFASDFRDGTEFANLFSGTGKSRELIDRLPSGPFMFAYAADLSDEGFGRAAQKLLSHFQGANGGGGAGNPFEAFMPGIDLDELVEDLDGVGQVVGAAPGAMMTGLLGNTVQILATDDPEGVSETTREAIASMDGRSAGGLKYTTSYTEGAQEIAGKKVDTYTLQMMPDPAAAQNQAMAQMGMPAGMMPQLLYGPAGGPSGFVAAGKDYVVVTASPNTPQLTNAIKAAEGENGLLANPGVRAVSDALPANRGLEVYVGLDQILNVVGPMAQMFTGQPFQQAPVSAPIALAAAPEDGGVLLRVYLPDQAIKSANQTFTDLAPLFGGMGGLPGGAPANPNEPRRPRF